MPPTRADGPIKWCDCETCTRRRDTEGLNSAERTYKALEWPRKGYTDLCPMRLADAEEMIDSAFEDQEQQQDNDRL